MDPKKIISKNLIIFVAATILIVWNIGSFQLAAQKTETSLTPSKNGVPGDGLGTPGVQQIQPPLGNVTNLPNATTYLNMFIFNLPIELTVVFLGEFFIGALVKTDKKRSTFLRLLQTLGVGTLLSVFSGLVNYLIVWPAMHDMPIHYPDPSFEYVPAETFFTPAVDVVMYFVAIIIILALHFLAFKFLLGYKYSSSGIGIIMPALYYFIVWRSLTKQKIPQAFWDKSQQHFYLALIFAGGFILINVLILIWNLSLATRKKPEKRAKGAAQTYASSLHND